MKKTFGGLLLSILLIGLGLFFYFFEHITFIRTPKKVIGPFTGAPPDTIYYCVPLHWAYILIALGGVSFLASIFFYLRSRRLRKL